MIKIQAANRNLSSVPALSTSLSPRSLSLTLPAARVSHAPVLAK